MLSARLVAAPAPGTVIGGRYRVERQLGSGGMGTVMAARHLELGHPVAIKVLLPGAAKNEESISRFLREGRAAAQLVSPHVAKVYDSGRLPSGEPYLVLELLHGRDLRSLLAETRKVPLARAIEWALQACEALGEAHRHQIVHRDVKPANLFVVETSAGPQIKVLDFGVAKQLDGAEGDLTQTASVLGTPRYMAPEQMRSARLVDGRCDVWSLGVVLYELTTGETPFRGDSVTALCFDVMERTPTAPSAIDPELPPAFDALVARCLSKDPDERFPTMEALAAGLRAVARGAGLALPPEARASSPSLLPVPAPRASSPSFIPAPPASSPHAAPERHSHGTLRSWDASPAPGTRRAPARRMIAVGLGLGVLAAGAGVWLLRGGRESPPPTEVGAPSASASPSGPTSAPGPTGHVELATPDTTGVVAAPAASVETATSTVPSPTASASGQPKAAAADGCRPPFWVDKNGHRHAKPWCP